jgi:hypothetical protein
MSGDNTPGNAEGIEPDFVPNFEWLPPQTGYAIDIHEVPSVEFGESSKLCAPFKGGGVDFYYGESGTGSENAGGGWHTHQPHTADLLWLIEGKRKIHYKDNQGKTHSIVQDAEEEQLVYQPAGAHNRVEVIEPTRGFDIKLGGGSVMGRLDLIAGNPDEHFDRKSFEHQGRGLDLDIRRGHVFHMNDDSVREW